MIVCPRGHSDDPADVHPPCEICGQEMFCKPAALEAQKKGHHLICRECYPEFSEWAKKNRGPK